jgi:hypothetical protein
MYKHDVLTYSYNSIVVICLGARIIISGLACLFARLLRLQLWLLTLLCALRYALKTNKNFVQYVSLFIAVTLAKGMYLT